MRLKEVTILSALVVAVGTTALTAQAQQTKTANIKVSATVVGNCLVTTGDVAFGNYDPVGANATAPADAAGWVELTCTRGVVASIGLDLGRNPAQSVRSMADVITSVPSTPVNLMRYELYQDAGRTSVWGDTSSNRLALQAAPSVAARRVPVYGRVPAAQDLPAGSYNDIVLVSVRF